MSEQFPASQPTAPKIQAVQSIPSSTLQASISLDRTLHAPIKIIITARPPSPQNPHPRKKREEIKTQFRIAQSYRSCPSTFLSSFIHPTRSPPLVSVSLFFSFCCTPIFPPYIYVYIYIHNSLTTTYLQSTPPSPQKNHFVPLSTPCNQPTPC